MLLTNASPRGAELPDRLFLHFSARGLAIMLAYAAFMSRSHLPGALIWRNRFAIELL
jgi:hypothetical protein